MGLLFIVVILGFFKLVKREVYLSYYEIPSSLERILS